MGSLRGNNRVMVLPLVDELSQRLPVSLLYRYYYLHCRGKVTYSYRYIILLESGIMDGLVSAPCFSPDD